MRMQWQHFFFQDTAYYRLAFAYLNCTVFNKILIFLPTYGRINLKGDGCFVFFLEFDRKLQKQARIEFDVLLEYRENMVENFCCYLRFLACTWSLYTFLKNDIFKCLKYCMFIKLVPKTLAL